MLGLPVPCLRRQAVCAVYRYMVLAAGAGLLQTVAAQPLAAENHRINAHEIPIDIRGAAPFNPDAARTNQGALALRTELGRQLFNDKKLSASGQLSCASCHDSAHAFSASNALPVQRGGRLLSEFGTRAVPTLKYVQTSPAFTAHYSEDEGAKAGQDNGPTGGLGWDGRSDNLQTQALLPLFSANEMAATPEHLQRVVQQAPYVGLVVALFGSEVLSPSQTPLLVQKITAALQTYQQNPAVFYPYTSKYDAVLRGKARLTAQEKRGLVAFNREDKGNCASCHPSNVGANGGFPQFTDYGYANLGLPRNRQIPANGNPNYFDLGLCGPLRHDLNLQAAYCGMFKVPTLRNVALKKSFYHNAIAHDLHAAVRFYAERDTHPERWYPRDKQGPIQRFNDAPAAYQESIEVEAPFGQRPGEQSPLSPRDIRDIVAFLQTLTDGYRP